MESEQGKPFSIAADLAASGTKQLLLSHTVSERNTQNHHEDCPFVTMLW